MATAAHPSDPDTRLAASQFIVTLGENTDYLDGKAAIFGKVVEGFDVLEKINNAIVDSNGYPFVDIRIKHTVVLDDPYPDPGGLREPSSSPPPSKAQLATIRIAEAEGEKLGDEDEDEDKAAAAEKSRREREARAQALTLELIGDLPFAEVKPPENVLFVCKLNPVTQDADLELIFSRFGKILSCEVIRDYKTGDSLQYAFVEFEEKSACEAAYFKMQGVLIDDRRIHVDFSQSVSKLSEAWRSATNNKRKGQARGKGGWGGVRELQKRRRYREVEDAEDESYEMVYGAEEMRGRHEKSQQRRDDAPGDTEIERHRESDPRRNGEKDTWRDEGRYRDERRRSRSPRNDGYRNSRDDGRRGDRTRGWDRHDHRDGDRIGGRRYEDHRGRGK